MGGFPVAGPRRGGVRGRRLSVDSLMLRGQRLGGSQGKLSPGGTDLPGADVDVVRRGHGSASRPALSLQLSRPPVAHPQNSLHT